MMLSNYFDSVVEGLRFLMALGSILGLFGLFVSCCLIMSAHHNKEKYYGLLILSIILLAICGLFYGVKYFRV